MGADQNPLDASELIPLDVFQTKRNGKLQIVNFARESNQP